jgi:hypothetical protein
MTYLLSESGTAPPLLSIQVGEFYLVRLASALANERRAMVGNLESAMFVRGDIKRHDSSNHRSIGAFDSSFLSSIILLTKKPPEPDSPTEPKFLACFPTF